MMLGGKDDGVQEDKGQDQPEHELRFANVFHCSLVLSVPPINLIFKLNPFIKFDPTFQISFCF